MSDFEHILLDLPGPDDHGIATLTLNRPEAMNAFTNVMVREMVEIGRASCRERVSQVV